MSNKQYSLNFAVFNALNSSVVLSEIQNFGSSLGKPQKFLQARLFRLSAQVKW